MRKIKLFSNAISGDRLVQSQSAKKQDVMVGWFTFAIGSPRMADFSGVIIPSLDLCASTATRRNDVLPAGNLEAFRC